MRPAASALAALLPLALAGAGCEEGRGRLVVVAPDPDRVAILEVFVARHTEGTSCEWLEGQVSRLEAEAWEDPTVDLQEELLKLEPKVGASRMRVDDLQPLGFFEAGPIVIFVRAWGEACDAVAAGCAELDVPAGGETELVVPLEPATSREGCREEQRCDRGQCVPCVDGECCADLDCNDGDAATTDVCISVSGEFGCYVAEDLDRDGVPAPDDCDDLDPEVLPGAEPACGRALDSDCDGVMDEAGSCDRPCEADGVVPGLVEAGRFQYPGLEFRAVAVVDDLVVAAAEETSTHQIVLWTGRLESGDEPLTELYGRPLDGSNGLAPTGVALYRDAAFVARTDDVEVFDLSSPEAPVHVGALGLSQDASTRGCRSCSVSPPLLWVGRFGGADVVELRGLSVDGRPRSVWTPEGQVIGTGAIFSAEGIAFWNRRVYLVDTRDRTFCSSDNRPGSIHFEECFDALATADNPDGLALGLLMRVAVVGSPDGTPWVFVLGNAAGHQHLTRLVEADGRLRVDETVEAAIGSPGGASTVSLVAAGDVLLRGADNGLFAYSASRLADAEPSELDVGSEGALDIAPAGSRVVVAAGSAGLVVVDLDCS